MNRFLYRGVLASLAYVFVVDGFLRLETNSTNITLVRDVVPWALALIGVAIVCTRPEAPSIRLPFLGLVVFYIAIALIELWNPDTISIRRGAAALRPHLEFVPLFFLGYAVMRTNDRLRGLALVFALAAAANGVVSIIQSTLTPAQLGTWGPGYAKLVTTSLVPGHLHNAATFVGSTGHNTLRPPALGGAVGFGGVLGMCALPFALALVVGSERKLHRVAGLVCLPLILAAVFTSQTRAAVVGTAVVTIGFVALLTVRQSARAAPALLVSVLAVVIVLIAGLSLARYSSITPARLVASFGAQRGGSIALIPTYARKYPFGAGLGTAGPGVAANSSVHAYKLSGENSFTYLIIELGLPGLICVVGLFVAAMQRGTRLVLSPLSPEARLYLAAIVAGLGGCAALSLSGGITAAPPLSIFIWLSVGVVAAWAPHAPAPIVRVLPRGDARTRRYSRVAKAPELPPHALQAPLRAAGERQSRRPLERPAADALPAAAQQPVRPRGLPIDGQIRSERVPRTSARMSLSILFNSGGRRVGGVADHAQRLASALREIGLSVMLIDWKQGRWTVADGGPVRSTGADEVESMLKSSECVLLEYSPFGMARWGFAPWAVLWAYRASRESRLVVFVHEPYLDQGRRHGRAISAWQRLQLRLLLRCAAGAVAPIERWANLLAALEPRLPVAHIPVGSNVPDRRHMRERRRVALQAQDKLVVTTFSTGHESRLDSHLHAALVAIAATGRSVLALNLGAGARELPAPPGMSVLSPGWLEAGILAEHLAASDLFLAPLVDGASMRRTTIAAALQHGLPVLSTDGPLTDAELRVEGSGVELVPADDCHAFAMMAARLAEDQGARARLGDHAREAYERRWSWSTARAELLALLERIPSRANPPHSVAESSMAPQPTQRSR